MSTKKGFLKGLIVKDSDPQNVEATAASAQVAGKATAAATPTIGMPTASNVSVQGVADNKFIEVLEGLIEQNNIPGQDYFEFKQAIENMKSLVMDEKSKFQTVYTVLSLQGCKKEILLSSIDTYVALIQSEKTNFDKELGEQYKSKVQSKLDEVERNKKELESLTKKLSELNTSILTLSQEAQAEELKIRATEANFKASADVIISEMVSDKDKINTFII